MKNLCSQLVKLESTSLVIVTDALVILRATHVLVIITSKELSSFSSYDNRYLSLLSKE